MSETPTCAVDECDRPCPDQAYVCERCTDLLERDLADVAVIEAELLTTRSGQVGNGERTGSRSSDDMIPYRVDASSAAWTLGNTVTTWARVVIESRGIEHRDLPPRPTHGPAHLLCTHDSCALLRGENPFTAASLASDLLVANLSWLRHQREGGEAVDEIRACMRNARSVIDRKPERWYAGTCGAETESAATCETELYAIPGAAVITCRTCRTEYDVKARREWLLDRAEDHLAHAELIARALSALGEDVTGAAIRGYAHRGRITAHGVDLRGRPTYRVGDVRDVARDVAAERERKATRRRAA